MNTYKTSSIKEESSDNNVAEVAFEIDEEDILVISKYMMEENREAYEKLA